MFVERGFEQTEGKESLTFFLSVNDIKVIYNLTWYRMSQKSLCTFFLFFIFRLLSSFPDLDAYRCPGVSKLYAGGKL